MSVYEDRDVCLPRPEWRPEVRANETAQPLCLHCIDQEAHFVCELDTEFAIHGGEVG